MASDELAHVCVDYQVMKWGAGKGCGCVWEEVDHRVCGRQRAHVVRAQMVACFCVMRKMCDARALVSMCPIANKRVLQGSRVFLHARAHD